MALIIVTYLFGAVISAWLILNEPSQLENPEQWTEEERESMAVTGAVIVSALWPIMLLWTAVSIWVKKVKSYGHRDGSGES